MHGLALPVTQSAPGSPSAASPMLAETRWPHDEPGLCSQSADVAQDGGLSSLTGLNDLPRPSDPRRWIQFGEVGLDRTPNLLGGFHLGLIDPTERSRDLSCHAPDDREGSADSTANGRPHSCAPGS